MNTGVIVAILVLSGSAFGSLLTYLIGARKLSGNIKNSDAESLWTEVRALTQEYKERIAELQEELKKCQERLNGA